MSPEDAVRVAVQDAISEAMRSVDGAMLTRWVLLAEVIDGDSGERALWSLTPDDMKKWDTLGMLTYAIQREQAGTVRTQLGGDS